MDKVGQESCEDLIRREMREEAGLKIEDLIPCIVMLKMLFGNSLQHHGGYAFSIACFYLSHYGNFVLTDNAQDFFYLFF